MSHIVKYTQTVMRDDVGAENAIVGKHITFVEQMGKVQLGGIRIK
jgi:hypothetical protein